ncbi:peroxidase-like [Ischnura elegans]|uniref:peroxidase-like n=1 Tax=Ischnura elegans TaxID=197161 RepID=UPI001ED8AB18|nr:peroxidase-like [Ischnura elegans]
MGTRAAAPSLQTYRLQGFVLLCLLPSYFFLSQASILAESEDDECAIFLLRNVEKPEGREDEGDYEDGPSHHKTRTGGRNREEKVDLDDAVTICISYSSVDDAFDKARKVTNLRSPFSPHRPIDNAQIAHLGETLLETSRILSQEYELTKEEMWEVLPRINTLKTKIAAFCPRFLQTRAGGRTCDNPGPIGGRFRMHDGSCNNLAHPTWGSARVAFRRFLPPDYADGLSIPRASHDGKPLPNPRLISEKVHRNEGYHDNTINLLFVAWGQMIDHDLTLTAETKDQRTREEPDCCLSPRPHPNCMPIILPNEDPFYGTWRQKCMHFSRSFAGVREDCRLGPRVQFNLLTSYIDANFIYGSSVRVSDSLRTLQGGLLATLPIFRRLGLRDLLPLKLNFPDDGCIRPNKDVFCFLAGDDRVNEQLVLAVLHTMFVREHNRMATELSKLNPHWDDERLYQETRHIMAAIVQHITYKEFLPLLLGKDTMKAFGLNLLDEGFSNAYDENVDATVTASFITAAFRFGHSLLPSTVERWSAASNSYIGSQRLSEMLRQPFDLYKPGRYDEYIVGLANQVAQAMDDAVTQEVTNHLFEKPNRQFGMDLASVNVQRAREHGVPSFASFRTHFCGLDAMPNSWQSMMESGMMPNRTTQRYNGVFTNPEDVDLWSAGISERRYSGSLVGPTFSCIIAHTFRRLKVGDRFWYENGGQPGSFTPDQLQEIRKVKLSRLLCDSGDYIRSMQVYALLLPDYEKNPRVRCNSRILPRIDLTKWKEKHPRDGNDEHFSSNEA